jgi:hypothetical protein
MVSSGVMTAWVQARTESSASARAWDGARPGKPREMQQDTQIDAMV